MYIYLSDSLWKTAFLGVFQILKFFVALAVLVLWKSVTVIYQKMLKRRTVLKMRLPLTWLKALAAGS